ncbi:hypothetical protein ACLBWH_12180 [Sphingomonas sp. M6A6_1c]
MPHEIRTDAALLARLRKAATTVMTGDQLRKQRVSFIHGNMPHESTMSRDEIEKALEQHEGTRQYA